jgi:hypothetical protein
MNAEMIYGFLNVGQLVTNNAELPICFSGGQHYGSERDKTR